MGIPQSQSRRAGGLTRLHIALPAAGAAGLRDRFLALERRLRGYLLGACAGARAPASEILKLGKGGAGAPPVLVRRIGSLPGRRRSTPRGIAAWKRQSGTDAATRSHRVTVEERARLTRGILPAGTICMTATH